jgi:hypothetical protein
MCALADRRVALIFGNRIVTLGGCPSLRPSDRGAKSKDPEAVYATTPRKGAFAGPAFCRDDASVTRHAVPSEPCDDAFMKHTARARNLLRWSSGLPRHGSGAVPSPLGSPRLAVGIRDGKSQGMRRSFRSHPRRPRSRKKPDACHISGFDHRVVRSPHSLFPISNPSIESR